MDDEARDALRERNRARSNMSCERCHAPLHGPLEHPLGMPFAVFRCGGCGWERTLVRDETRKSWKRPGGRR